MYTFRFDIGQCVYPGALTFNTTGTIQPFQVVGRVVEQCSGGTKGIYILRTPTLTLLQVAEWEVISFSEAETIVRLNTLDKKKADREAHRQFWKEIDTDKPVNAKTEPADFPDQPDQADQPKKPWEECPPGFERTE